MFNEGIPSSFKMRLKWRCGRGEKGEGKTFLFVFFWLKIFFFCVCGATGVREGYGGPRGEWKWGKWCGTPKESIKKLISKRRTKTNNIQRWATPWAVSNLCKTGRGTDLPPHRAMHQCTSYDKVSAVSAFSATRPAGDWLPFQTSTMLLSFPHSSLLMRHAHIDMQVISLTMQW